MRLLELRSGVVGVVCSVALLSSTAQTDTIYVDDDVVSAGDLASVGAPKDVGAPGGPTCVATGPDENADGYCRVCADPYGSVGSVTFGGGGDLYNPVGASPGAEATFTHGFFFFQRDDDTFAGISRELLSNILDWQNVFAPDDTVDRSVTAPNTEFDDNDDNVTDRLEASYDLDGVGINLSVDMTQELEIVVPLAGGTVAVLTQTMVIQNDGGDITFDLLNHWDADLVWDAGGDFADDSVGTGTNGSPLDRHVYQGDSTVGDETYITISSPDGELYYGSKLSHVPTTEPTCNAGVPTTMGFGTDLQQWDDYGVPCGWNNYIAGPTGADTNGESDTDAGDGSTDASIGLNLRVTIAGGASTTVVVSHTYGAKTPSGQSDAAPSCFDVVSEDVSCHPDGTSYTYTVEGINLCTGDAMMFSFTGSGGAVGEELCFTVTINDDEGVCCTTELCVTIPDCSKAASGCPWDLDHDGSVGINDLLTLLAAWGPVPTPDPPDFDGDGYVGITDFLELLAHWGPCA